MNRKLIISLSVAVIMSFASAYAAENPTIYTDGIGRIHFLGRDDGNVNKYTNPAEQDLTRKLYEKTKSNFTTENYTFSNIYYNWRKNSNLFNKYSIFSNKMNTPPNLPVNITQNTIPTLPNIPQPGMFPNNNGPVPPMGNNIAYPVGIQQSGININQK